MTDTSVARRAISALLERHPELLPLDSALAGAASLLVGAFETGHKVLVCGNGGSAADADHIVGELMKGFTSRRPVTGAVPRGLAAADSELGPRLADSLQMGLSAIALTQHAALISAFANDVDPEMVYAQQVLGYGVPGDILWGITTSGNAKNVNYAAVAARARGTRGRRHDRPDRRLTGLSLRHLPASARDRDVEGTGTPSAHLSRALPRSRVHPLPVNRHSRTSREGSPPRPLTMADIASEAGVSKATVSRVLSNPEIVNAETRRIVLDIMNKHEYVPNALARG